MRGAGCTVNDMWDRKYDAAGACVLLWLLQRLLVRVLLRFFQTLNFNSRTMVSASIALN